MGKNVDAAAPRAEQVGAGVVYPAGVEIRVLGPLEVSQDGQTVPVGGPKQRSILAVLVAHLGQPVSLDRLVDGVYGETAADGARHSVQTYISAIRRDLGDVVRKDSGGYVLTVDSDTVDAVRFEDAVRSTLPLLEDDPEFAATSLREALGMWRGHAYADVGGSGVFEPEQTRLAELRLAALEARIDADLALGRHRELLGELDALTIEHPLRERFRVQQMLALYRCGRQTDALRVYDRARTYLNDEIGIDPSPELRTMEQRILDQDPDLDLPAAPSLTRRAVLVIDVADARTWTGFDPADRASLMEGVAGAFGSLVEHHGGEGVGQRGSALYAALPTVGDAAEMIGQVAAAAMPATIRTAIDYGDVEVHESGEVVGPPVRRSAGIVAAAHGGQVLLSAGAQQALLEEGTAGWLLRGLGLHPIHGVDEPQQVFQLVLDGQEREFPPLLLDTTPPPLPTDRGAVAGYELRRPITSNLSGTTYQAYQPSVGREVLVSIIDPVWANRPEFISRFEVETQLVTRLQHPHIVPVIDYWRDPSGAYLVSPSIAGPSLADSIHVAELDFDDRRRLISQIGEALAHAHQLGVIHGGLAPDSVTLDTSGNAYLTGSGFVVRLVDAPRAASPYTAPEQDRNEPVTTAVDVYGLARLTEALLGESYPSHGTGAPGTSAAIAQLVAAATAERPEDRVASVSEFLAELATILGEAEPAVVFTDTRNPYKGLNAFGEADAGDFFGRSEIVAQLTEMLIERRLVAVVGPSGSGKSSLVKAGLVPAVRAGTVDPSDHWVVTDMFPGSYPFAELESALASVAVEDPGGMTDDLDRDAQGLVRVIKRILPGHTRLLLIIDQFEEAFTLTRDQATRDRFLAALVALARDERSDVRVVLTLRADFFDRPLQYPEFGELLKAGMFALTTPAPGELAEAIRRPAESVGVAWEPGLVEQIVEDVADAPGSLPLLQYALTEIFAARRSDELTHDSYRAAGGVLGALGTHASQVFEDLDPRTRAVARQLFLRLVSVQPSGELTRRRARLVDLNATADSGDLEAVLSAFGEARLLTFDRDPVMRGPTVEVAHEALLTRWSRLAEWITEAREDLLLHHRLADAVGEWDQHDRDEGYLLVGGRLAQFQAWAAATDLALAPTEVDFLELSAARSERDRTRRRRVRNLVTAGFAVVAVIAVVLGLLAFLSRQDAIDNAELAHSRELAASAVNVLDEDPELSLLLALEAAGASDPTVESVSALHESVGAHRKILTYVWPADQELSQNLMTRLSPDGRSLVASSGGTYVEVVDVESGEQSWSRDFGGDGISRALFTSDGLAVVVTYGWSPVEGAPELNPESEALLGVHLLDAGTGAPLRQFPMGPCGVLSSHSALTTFAEGATPYLTAELDDDPECSFGGVLAETQSPGNEMRPPVSVINLETGQTERLSDVSAHAFQPPSARVSTDGGSALLGVQEGPATHLVDQSTGDQLATLEGWPIAISADGSVATTVGPPELLAWDLRDGAPPEPVLVPTVTDFSSLSPDGTVVAEVGTSSIKLWDTRTGDQVDELLAGLGSYDTPSFSADSSRLVVNEVFGTTGAVFDLAAPAEVDSVTLCGPMLSHEAMRNQVGMVEVAGGTTAVRAYCPGSDFLTQFLVDSDSYQVNRLIAPSAGYGSALSPDGLLLAAQRQEESITGPLELRDLATDEVVLTLEGLCEHQGGSGPDCVPFPDTPWADWIWDLSYSPDGSLLAMGGDNGTDAVVVWDVAARQIVARATVPHNTDGPDRVLDVEFAPDGRTLAAAFGWSPRELWLLSTDDWTPIGQYRPPAAGQTEAPSASLVFTPDGGTLIAADSRSGKGAIVFMDGSTLEHLAEIPDAHDGAVSQLTLNEDGTLLASAGLDGVVRVWDVATRALVHEIPLEDEGAGLGGVGFMEDDQHLSVVMMTTGELHLVTTDTDELLAIARSRVTRSFTDTECATYRVDPCPTLEEIRAG